MFWNIWKQNEFTLFYFNSFDDSPITVSSFWFLYFSEEGIEFNSFGYVLKQNVIRKIMFWNKNDLHNLHHEQHCVLIKKKKNKLTKENWLEK